MLSISNEANKNYLCRVVQLKGVKKHPNADKLKMVTIDFQNVIIGDDYEDGDICVYFPVESQINFEFLSHTNSFSDKTLNRDKEVPGYFGKQGRVRAVKLRGERSFGYVVRVSVLCDYFQYDYLPLFEDSVGQEFDTIEETLMCKKYVVPVKQTNENRAGKKPRISRLVDGQVHLHVDTENFRKEAYKIDPEDYISVTYKTHGTSWWVSNVLVKRKLTIFDKLLKLLGVRDEDTEYDYIYGSRKVVKNLYLEDPKAKDHFYEYDIWEEIKEELKEFIPKGYTLYGEALGYTKSGAYIQEGYDYGCEVGKKRIQIYRITFTNPDGFVINLTSQQTMWFCEQFGLEYVHHYYFGKAKDLFKEISTEQHWHEEFVKRLEQTYTEADCFMSKNKVPEEGIVIRKEKLTEFEAYKLKSFNFLERETAMLDKGEADLESTN